MTDDQAAPAPPRLSPNQRTQLARLLLECPTMKEAGSRAAIIDGLPAVANTIARDSAPLTVVIRLVNECLNQERGLADLLETLRAAEGGSLQLRNVELFLKSV
ncbi:MAG TPA: hypothetical protein VD886_15680 [Herpetosiphonaceae bacterium]|nr:hypothetical protein [Herpetosiphonaceae bacterium]